MNNSVSLSLIIILICIIFLFLFKNTHYIYNDAKKCDDNCKEKCLHRKGFRYGEICRKNCAQHCSN